MGKQRLQGFLIVVLSVVFYCTSPLMASDLTNGLLGYSKFDENSGTSAADSSGNGQTATLTTGATWGNGKKQYALSLDGVDDKVTTTARFEPSAGSTSAWVFPTATATNSYVVYGLGASTNRFYTHYNADLKCSRGNPSAQVTVKSNAALNTWHHFGCAWDATTLYGYYNGNFIGSVAYTNTSAGTTLVYIGHQNGVANTTFPGYIDEVRVYDRKLSNSEYRQLFLGNNPNVDGM